MRAAAIKSLEYSRWVPLGTVEEAAVAVDYLKAQVTDETTSKRDMGRKHNIKEFLAGYRRKTISSHPPYPCVCLSVFVSPCLFVCLSVSVSVSLPVSVSLFLLLSDCLCLSLPLCVCM